ncbi:MAG: phospholipase D family protein [Gammaproteobacteria bacterium]
MRHFLLFGICVLQLHLAGCATPEFKEPSIPPLPIDARGAESSCAADAALNCAHPSPFHALSKELQDGQKNRVALIEEGAAALAARVHLIRSARRSISLQTYIWSADEVGTLMVAELLAAAKRGVRVRLIVDQLYSGQNAQQLASLALAHRNLEIKMYNPLGQEAVATGMDKVRGVLFDFQSLNHRMHNKLMVFDDEIAVTGGRNIENKYYDYDPHFNFIDRDVLVAGDVVKTMADVFETYWNDPIVVELDRLKDVRAVIDATPSAAGDRRFNVESPRLFDALIAKASDSTYIKSTFIDSAFAVRELYYTADRPQKPFVKNESSDQNISARLRETVANATQRLTVQTPYFILSNPAYAALKDMREHQPGIQYSVVTNSLATTDHYFVYALSYKRRKRNVQNLGFNVFEMKPFPIDKEHFVPRYRSIRQADALNQTFTPIDLEDDDKAPSFAPVPVNGKGPRLSIHAKSLVVDGRIGVVGSHNFDPRSGAINTESALIIVDEAFAGALERNIQRVMAPGNAWVAARRQTVPFLGRISGFIGSISRALPLFDVWPFRYTSSFDLKSGQEAVAPNHPEFYQRYKDVGQFPGTSLGDDQIKTYLVSGFGAVSEPLM